jgi:hypothetical protein
MSPAPTTLQPVLRQRSTSSSSASRRLSSEHVVSTGHNITQFPHNKSPLLSQEFRRADGLTDNTLIGRVPIRTSTEHEIHTDRMFPRVDSGNRYMTWESYPGAGNNAARATERDTGSIITHGAPLSSKATDSDATDESDTTAFVPRKRADEPQHTLRLSSTRDRTRGSRALEVSATSSSSSSNPPPYTLFNAPRYSLPIVPPSAALHLTHRFPIPSYATVGLKRPLENLMSRGGTSSEGLDAKLKYGMGGPRSWTLLKWVLLISVCTVSRPSAHRR